MESTPPGPSSRKAELGIGRLGALIQASLPMSSREMAQVMGVAAFAAHAAKSTSELPNVSFTPKADTVR